MVLELVGGELGLSLWAVLGLIGVFFLTSAVSMVTGSTSLITVPVMLQVRVEPQVAIATNMTTLILMSVLTLNLLLRP